MKTITLLLDGLGDRTYKCLDHKTPLDYADTPNLDKLAESGQCGMLTPYKYGVSLGTDLAHMLLFGYKMSEYPGRAVIDTIGEGVKLSANQLVMRCSWAHVELEEDNKYLLKSRFTKDLSDHEIENFCQDLSCCIDGVDFKVIHSYDSHGFVVMTGDNISDAVSDSDPFYVDQYLMAVEPFETEATDAIRTAGLINEFINRSYSVLNKNAINARRKKEGLELANILLTKWAGSMTRVESFESRTGMKGLFLGKSKMLHGLADYLDMDYWTYDNFQQGVKTALECDYDYVHLHTKDTDEASHKKDPLEKVRVLETLDKQIKDLLEFEGFLVVTADHSTPCSGQMIHSGESVPIMGVGEYIRRDRVNRFSELDCSGGSLHLTGETFMYWIHNCTDRGNLCHLRSGNKWRNYKPKYVKPLIKV